MNISSYQKELPLPVPGGTTNPFAQEATEGTEDESGSFSVCSVPSGKSGSKLQTHFAFSFV